MRETNRTGVYSPFTPGQLREAFYIKVLIHPNYAEDIVFEDIINIEGYAAVVIQINSGRVINWKEGHVGHIRSKLSDMGKYTLLDECFEVLYEEDCYVPQFLSPLRRNFNDWLDLEINEKGHIKGWAEIIDDLYMYD